MQQIHVAGRISRLSQAQIEEVIQEISLHVQNLTFKKTLLKTSGDLDLKTSLRTLGKTDFFTKEIDELLKKGGCRIAIHSAKDLPEIIDPELLIVAITKGVDPSDSLVLRENVTLESLKDGAVIGASSEKREQAVQKLIKKVVFKDIRGTIESRLAQLESGIFDGVVIAEAALIRLKLLNLNRIRLEGETTKYQGRLAILARKDDEEMKALFSCIDTR